MSSPEVATATSERTAVQRQEPRLNRVREMLEKSRANLEFALPKTIRPEFMIRVVLTSVQRTPELLECEPITLVGAVFQAAQLGLVPDGVMGQAYLVPFWNKHKRRKEVQFIPGYRGLIALARRSNEISTVGAEVVYEKDAFTYELGINPVLKHTPSDEANPGQLVRTYAYAKLKDGGFQIAVMNRRQVEAIRARSQAATSGKSSPWTTDEAWMWKKTVLKQLCKLLPAAIELQEALALDDRASVGIPQDLAMFADSAETATPIVEESSVPLLPAAVEDTEASHILAAAKSMGWDQRHLTTFIQERFKVQVTALKRGKECHDALRAVLDQQPKSPSPS